MNATAANLEGVPGREARRESRAPALALPWIVPLRLLLIVGEAVMLVFAGHPSERALAWSWAGAAFAAQLAAQYWLTRATARHDESSERAMGLVFALDAVALTGVFYFTGGAANPFTLFYLVQITLSAVLLHKHWTWALGVLSTLCYGTLFLLPERMVAHPAAASLDLHLIGMWVAFAFVAGEITFFTGQVAEALQRRRREVLELQKQVARQERLTSLVTLAGGAAHEMGTPLGTIAITAREMERVAELRHADPDLLEDARLIREQVDRCRDILAEMSAKGGEPSGEPLEDVSVGELLGQVRHRLHDQRQSRLDVADFGADVRLMTFPSAAVQSLLALVRNALAASAPQASVWLGVTSYGDDITFAVRDKGSGMDDETLARVMEPFFSRKPTGQGMGLGAFLVHLFATRVGGELRYESEPGRGTTAFLTLPRKEMRS